MAWNPSPRVGALRDYATEFGDKVVVTFSIECSGDSFNITTFGKTKTLCKLAAHFGDQIVARVMDGTIVPPETEPFNEPVSSRTWTAAETPEPEEPTEGEGA